MECETSRRTPAGLSIQGMRGSSHETSHAERKSGFECFEDGDSFQLIDGKICYRFDGDSYKDALLDELPIVEGEFVYPKQQRVAVFHQLGVHPEDMKVESQREVREAKCNEYHHGQPFEKRRKFPREEILKYDAKMLCPELRRRGKRRNHKNKPRNSGRDATKLRRKERYQKKIEREYVESDFAYFEDLIALRELSNRLGWKGIKLDHYLHRTGTQI